MKIQNGREDIFTEIKRIVTNQYLKKKKSSANKSDNVGEMDKFLER